MPAQLPRGADALPPGVGGQVDFIRGASICPDGKPIIAVPSITKKGVSRIVPLLKPGAGVTTTRAHVHYVVRPRLAAVVLIHLGH